MTATRVISIQTADELLAIIEELKNDKLQLIMEKTALMEDKWQLVKKLNEARNGLYVIRRTVALALDQLG